MDFGIPANMKFCSRSSIARLAAGRSRRAWLVLLALAGPAAARFTAELEERGFPVTVQTAEVGEKTFSRVALTGFKNRQGAAGFKDGIANALGFRSAWIVRQ